MRNTTHLLVLSAIFCAIYSQSTTCPLGQFFDATQKLCMNCTMGCAHCFGPSPKECIEFEPGFILGSNNNVLKCADPCHRCEPSDLNRCIGCKVGWHEVTISSTQKNCSKCSTPNCAVCSNDTAICDRCILGYNLDSDKNCKQCPAHCKICDENSNCKLCEDNFYLTPNMACNPCNHPNCVACNPNGSCKACSPGFSLDLESGTCTKCDLNGCLSCSQNLCKECAPGYILTNGKCQTPTNTIPNCDQYTTTTDSRCASCKPGFFLTSEGKCQACDPNCKQCTGPTPQDCLTCHPGKFLFTNPSTLARSCVSNCSINSATDTLIADPNTGICRACPFSCAVCNDVESCERCLPGFTPMEVDTVINGIPRKVKKCMPCHATCKTCAGVNASQCLECQPGLNKTEAASVPGRCFSDTNCGEGFFYNDMTKSCSQCSPGCKACKSNTVCDRCQDGLFNNNGVCTNCPTDCNVCKSDSFCLVCPPGLVRSVIDENTTECLNGCPKGHRVVETPDFDLEVDADSASDAATSQVIGKDTPCGKFLWRVGRVIGLYHNYVSTGKILPPDALDRLELSTGASVSKDNNSVIPDDPFSVIKQYTTKPQFSDYVVDVTLMALISTTTARYAEQIAKIDSAFLSANGIDVNAYIGNIINEQNQELIQSFWQVLSQNGTNTANFTNICPKLPFKPSELFTFNFQRFFKELEGVRCFTLPSLDKAVSWGQDLLIANQRALDSNTDGEAAPKQIYEMLNNIAKQFNFNPQCHGIDLPKTSEWKTFIGGLINVHVTYNIPFDIFFPFFNHYFRYKQIDPSNRVNQACVPCKFNCSECPPGWFRMENKPICNAQCPAGYKPNETQMTCVKESLSNLQVNIVWLSQSLLTRRQEQLVPLTLRAVVLGNNANERPTFYWDIEGDNTLRSKIFTSNVVRNAEYLKIQQFDWLDGLDQVTFKVSVSSSPTRNATQSIVINFSPPPTFSIDKLDPPSGSQIMLKFNGEIPADTLAVILVRLESAAFKISTQVEIKESAIPIKLPQVSKDTQVTAFIKSPSTTFEFILNFIIKGENLTPEQVKEKLNQRVDITSSTDASNAVTETIDKIQILKDQDKEKPAPTDIKDDDPNKEILTAQKDECNGCQNKGVCKIDGGRQFCICPKEWKGQFCEVSAETTQLVNERVSEIAEQIKHNMVDGDAANKIMIVSQLKDEADSFDKENRQKLQEIVQESLKDLTQQIKEQKRQTNSNSASDVAYDPQQDGFDPSKLGRDQFDATSGFIPKEVVLAAFSTVTQLIKSSAAEALEARLQKEVTKELDADIVLKTLAREQSLAAENFKQLIGAYVLAMQSDSDKELDIGEAKARFEKLVNNGQIPKIFLTLLENPSGKRMLDTSSTASVTILSTELINSGAQVGLSTMPASSISALNGYNTLVSGDQVYTVGFYMDNGEEFNFAGAPNAYQLTVPCSSDVSTELMCSEIDTTNNRIHGIKSVESYDPLTGQCTCSLAKAGMFSISYVEDPAPLYPGYSSGSVLALPLTLILVLLAIFT